MPSRFLSSIFLTTITFAILSGCSKQENLNNIPANTTEKDSVVSESSIDFDQDGKDEKVIVTMSAGRYWKEEIEGPFLGWNWTGRFAISTIKGEETLASSDLNKAFSKEELNFNENYGAPFSLQFVDYNNDDLIDFSLGQYFSGNGFVYKLFTIKSSGEIEILPVSNQPTLFSVNNGYSAKFEKVNDTTFKTIYYDNTTGEYLEDYFVWDGQIFIESKNLTANPEETDKELTVTEKKFVGTWQASPTVGSGLNDHYMLKTDRTFTFNYNQMDCAKSNISFSGYWKIEQDTLVLTVGEKTHLVGGELVPATGSCASEKELIDGKEVTDELSTPQSLEYPLSPIESYDAINDLPRRNVLINGVRYWEISD